MKIILTTALIIAALLTPAAAFADPPPDNTDLLWGENQTILVDPVECTIETHFIVWWRDTTDDPWQASDTGVISEGRGTIDDCPDWYDDPDQGIGVYRAPTPPAPPTPESTEAPEPVDAGIVWKLGINDGKPSDAGNAS